MTICTLVPVYKKEFFSGTLISLGTQRLKPSKVIFSDDSPDHFLLNDHSIKRAASQILPETEIVYLQGPRVGPLSNIKFLLGEVSEEHELIHVLFDDDLIFPDFYLAHQTAFSRYPSARCVVSFRWFLSELNIPIGAPPVPVFVRFGDRYQPIPLHLLASSTVPFVSNWLGELSNTTFRGRTAAERIFDVCNPSLPVCGLEDIGTFAKFSDEGSLLLMADFLSGFRVSSSNNTANKQSENFKAAVLGWVPISLFALSRSCITSDQHWECVGNVLATAKSLYAETDPLLVKKLELYYYARSENLIDFSGLWFSFLEQALDYRGPYNL